MRSPAEVEIAKGIAVERRADVALKAGDRSSASTLYQRALGYFQRAISLDPKAATAYRHIGRTYIALRRHKPAILLLKQALIQLPDDLDVQHYLGLHLFLAKRKREAIPLLERVAAQVKHKPDVSLILGRYFWKTEKFAKAAPHLRNYLRLKPSSVKARRWLAASEMGSGQFSAALETFKQLRKDDPRTSMIGVARATAGLGKHAQAASRFEAALRSYPNAGLEIELSEQYRRASLLERAIKAARAYERKYPRRADGARQLGLIFMQQNRIAEAIASLEKARRLDAKSIWTLYFLARSYRRAKRAKEALPLMQAALRSAPKNTDFLDELGRIYRAQGSLEQAIALHQRLLKGAPDNAGFRVQLAKDQLRASKLDAAEASYRAVLGKQPKHYAAKRGLVAVKVRQAKLAIDAGKINEARHLLVTATTIAWSPTALRNLAIVDLHRGKIALARASVQRLRRTEHWNKPTVLRIRARLLMAEGKNAPATKLLTQAMRALRGIARREVRAELAVAHARAGNLEAAIRGFSAAPRNLAITLLVAGDAALRKGETEAALEHLTKAAQHKDALEQESALLLDLLLSMVRMRGSVAQAKQLLRLARQKKTIAKLALPAARKSAAKILTAYAWLRQDNPKASAAALRGVRKPTGAVNALRRESASLGARRLYAARRFRRARRALVMLARRYPSAASTHDLACVNYALGKRAAALKVFRAMAPRVVSAIANVGIALDDLGQPKAAYDEYMKYLARVPGPSIVRRWVDAKRRIFGFGGGAE